MIRLASASCLAVVSVLGVRGAMAANADTATIAGQVYRFPNDVFADGMVQHGRQGSLLLMLSWPGMRSPDDVGDASEQQSLQVLLNETSARDATAVDRSIDLDAHLHASLDPHKHAALLTVMPAQAVDAPAGLVQVLTDNDNSLGEDVFVKQPLTRPSEFVTCSRKSGYVDDPLCSQEFGTSGLVIKVTYSRRMLSEWAHVRAVVLTYLNRHKISP
ncbi:MAG: hypothetical protein ACRYG8_52945 [Janthinobacterium lividum]